MVGNKLVAVVAGLRSEEMERNWEDGALGSWRIVEGEEGGRGRGGLRKHVLALTGFGRIQQNTVLGHLRETMKNENNYTTYSLY